MFPTTSIFLWSRRHILASRLIYRAWWPTFSQGKGNPDLEEKGRNTGTPPQLRGHQVGHRVRLQSLRAAPPQGPHGGGSDLCVPDQAAGTTVRFFISSEIRVPKPVRLRCQAGFPTKRRTRVFDALLYRRKANRGMSTPQARPENKVQVPWCVLITPVLFWSFQCIMAHGCGDELCCFPSSIMRVR